MNNRKNAMIMTIDATLAVVSTMIFVIIVIALINMSEKPVNIIEEGNSFAIQILSTAHYSDVLTNGITNSNDIKEYLNNSVPMQYCADIIIYNQTNNITFNKNYWDDWIGLKGDIFRSIPKIIPGFRKYWHKVLNILPVFEFDMHPALEPY